MRTKSKLEGFGFNPKESVHRFLVTILASNREEVLISEHFSYDEPGERSDLTFSAGASGG